MQTGQNSIAPENSLPQLGQVRWGFVLIVLAALLGIHIDLPIAFAMISLSRGIAGACNVLLSSSAPTTAVSGC
jgi:hypothetical protein